jgi:SpoU rRNA methylase family enzyme
MSKSKVILSLFVSLLLLTTACARAATPTVETAQSMTIEKGLAPAQPQPYEGAAEDSGGLRPVGLPSPTERIVLKNASLDIVVDQPSEAMDAIGKMAEEMGGFIVNANLTQMRLASGAEVPSATITIRVPAERLDEALDRIEAMSNLPVENKSINSQDVTSEYTDLQSRLRNLEAAEAQLLEIMKQAYKTEDVLNVFNQLTQVREQIEVVKGQIKYYEESASLSSITVNILPNEAAQPLTIGKWQPVGVAKDAIQALIKGLQVVVNVAIWLVLFVIPILIVIGIPPFLIIRGILRWRKRRKAAVIQSAPPSGS